jgi:hypothetical protein
MKKKYISPEIKVMDIKMSGMLCVSGGLGGTANQDALSPDLLDYTFDYDINENQ